MLTKQQLEESAKDFAPGSDNLPKGLEGFAETSEACMLGKLWCMKNSGLERLSNANEKP